VSRTVICDKAAEAVAGVLTGLRCVRRVYTDHATFDIDADAGTVRVRETFGIAIIELASRMKVDLH
jgi:3-oxoadipate CoA-transferase, beta subunit